MHVLYIFNAIAPIYAEALELFMFLWRMLFSQWNPPIISKHHGNFQHR